MKKTLQLFCSSFVFIFLVQFTAWGQKIDYAKVDATISSLVAKNKFSGVVLIAQKGKIKYEKANGFIEYVNQTPLTFLIRILPLDSYLPIQVVFPIIRLLWMSTGTSLKWLTTMI
ncbi:MAG: hypothetical protein NTY43_00815 [Bacteroidetes bacterium]|nr:hypothetical protein [Bacteroidota bacterium]